MCVLCVSLSVCVCVYNIIEKYAFESSAGNHGHSEGKVKTKNEHFSSV